MASWGGGRRVWLFQSSVDSSNRPFYPQSSLGAGLRWCHQVCSISPLLFPLPDPPFFPSFLQVSIAKALHNKGSVPLTLFSKEPNLWQGGRWLLFRELGWPPRSVSICKSYRWMSELDLETAQSMGKVGEKEKQKNKGEMNQKMVWSWDYMGWIKSLKQFWPEECCCFFSSDIWPEILHCLFHLM